LFRQWGILELFRQWGILELFRQWGIVLFFHFIRSPHLLIPFICRAVKSLNANEINF
jgi:hypothetical protein